MPMTIQPVPTNGIATLHVDVSCANSAGVQSGGPVLLDRTNAAGTLVRPPWMQAPEYQLDLKGGQANTITVSLSALHASSLIVEAVDVQWEAIKR